MLFARVSLAGWFRVVSYEVWPSERGVVGAASVSTFADFSGWILVGLAAWLS